MKPVTPLLILLLCMVFLVSCTHYSADQIKQESFIGKEVTLEGKVTQSIKLGDLSGYKIKDEQGEEIGVSAQSLPQEGTEVKVTGVVARDSLFGYYIIETERSEE